MAQQTNSQPADVLAVMKEASGFALSQSYSLPTNEECEQAEALVARINEARAAVAEFIKRAEYLCRTGEGMIAFRAALARIAPNELHDKAAELRGRGE